MIMYLAIMSFVGWVIPKMMMAKWKGWPVVLLAILAGWFGGIISGFGLLAIEIPSLGAEAALGRFAPGLLTALIVSVWTAIANRSGRK